ncbi:MAG: serine/threonine protein kinase, partial [Acidimicrobiales bacterium]
PPYPARSVEQAVGAHLTQPPPRPSELRPGRVPMALDEVVAIGMAKNPEGRYASAGDLAAAAHDALAEPEQHQAARILRRGEDATMRARAVDPGATGSRMRSTAAGIGVETWTPAGRPPPTQSRLSQPRIPSPVSHAPPPDFRPPPQYDDQRKRGILIGAVALVIVAVIAAVAYLATRPSQSASTSASGQSVLPFEGIDFRLSPSGVAVDNAGNVYVTSEGMYGRVVKLPPGSSSPAVLPFNGLYQPQALAVDSASAVYVTDFNNRVVKLTDGSNDQTVLPFDGLNYPEGVAVDTDGSVYVADRGNNRVVKLAAGSNAQTVLPFDGLKDPDGVAVDKDGA